MRSPAFRSLPGRIAMGLLVASAPLIYLRRLRGSEAPPLEFNYERRAQSVLNRDGGPWNHIDLMTETPEQLRKHKITFDKPAGYTLGPLRLIHANICLNPVGVNFADCSATNPNPKPITPEDVRKIDSALQKAEDARIKIILRFIYNHQGDTSEIPPGEDPCAGGQDAPMHIILRDIASLAPVVAKHRNIILAMNAGFIGYWGEGHDSCYGNNTPEKTRIFMDAEETFFGPFVTLMSRYPSNILDWEPKHRVIWGIHDDHYTGDSTDAHTWLAPTWSRFNYSTQTLEEFGATRSDEKPFSGEIGAVNPALQSPDLFTEYSRRFHLNSMSVVFHNEYLVSTGQYRRIVNRIGPVIGLTHASLDGQPGAGVETMLGLNFENIGFSRLFVKVPVYFVLTNAAGEKLDDSVFRPVRVPVDLTSIDPDCGQLFASVRIRFPYDLEPGATYYAALWLPDPDPKLRTMHEYNYLLNNKDVPSEASGLNKLFPIHF